MTENPTPTVFDDWGDAYDLLIDWPKRLANEGPFFQKRFAEAGVQRVLDAACGTGHHAAMFHRWGLAVEGADLSAAMIARCRARFGEEDGLRWAVRSFEEPCGAPGRFDAVVCVGNSLALVADLAAVERASASMIAALRPGGVGVLQVLNLWRVHEGPTSLQKCEVMQNNEGRRILLKGLHRAGSRGYIDLIDLQMTSAGWVKRFDTPSFLGIEAKDLSAAVRSNGGRDLQLYGNYQEEPYDREQSADLICVFRS